MRRLILASSSSSRLSILRSAGFDPEVWPSGVDEDETEGDIASIVLALARRKAESVAERVGDALVLGCDSILDLGGKRFGKPQTIDEARTNWQELSGASATLHTGHCLIDMPKGSSAQRVCATKVQFLTPSAKELEAYLLTGESLMAAGGFTLEGYGAPFVESVFGDALNVMGVSPATLRHLCRDLDIALEDLWPKGTPSLR